MFNGNGPQKKKKVVIFCSLYIDTSEKNQKNGGGWERQHQWIMEIGRKAASYPSVVAGLKENTCYIRYELFRRNPLTNAIIYFQTPNSYFPSPSTTAGTLQV